MAWLGLAWLAGAAPARAAEFPDRLIGISTRARVGAGEDVMIAGFVVKEGAPKKILIRAGGPALTAYGVGGALADPRVAIFTVDGLEILNNDDWGNPGIAELPATLSALGVPAFANNSKDATLLATLAPGAYTAQVSGVGGATGVALVEVYDVTGAPRLLGLSTRGKVGTGGDIMIAGLVISQTAGTRRVLLRAVGPSLSSLGVSGVLADPVIGVFRGSEQIAGNDNWDTNTNAATITDSGRQLGLWPLPAGSKDAAVVLDLAPGAYTVHVAGVGATTGVVLTEAYDLTPDTIPLVSVAATTAATTTTTGGSPAVFTISRVGSNSVPLTVDFRLSGTAVPGVDFNTVPTSVTIPAGANSATVAIQAIPGSGNAGTNKDVTLTLTPATSYGLGSSTAASVSIFYESGALFLSNLRAAGGSASTAFGTATIQMSPDGTFALVNVAFSNLTSPEVLAYIRIGGPNETGDPLVRLPIGQVAGFTWTIRGTGPYSAADIVAALREGRVFVSISSANYPDGELRGSFLRATGSQQFVAPPAPPALPGGTPTDAEAARFLMQATFGPKAGDIDLVKQRGYAGWIDDQIAKPLTSHRAETLADFAANNEGGQGGSSTTPNTRPGSVHRQAAWWKIALNGDDQLRQRVAFALSELFVVSDLNDTLSGQHEGLAHYYDHMARGAFGNFRDLLEEVSLSPVMGVYLSHLRNSKANPKTGALPDENFAREVMQLFTVGLVMLQPDGSLQLDAQGMTIPTYDQTTITETAKIFTGWAFPSTDLNAFRYSPSNYVDRMQLFPAYHDDSIKKLLNGVTLPASQGGVKDLKDALDAFFNHPNCGPFVSRQLIQRLVTSNPSPGYIYRVAQVFANNGRGVRGDMAAVVRAILLDYEARSGQVAASASYGKLKEPLLRATALLRAVGATPATGARYPISSPQGSLAQAALRSPTVFNFFEPNYVFTGELAAAGLVAPEYQILTDMTAITIPNFLYSLLYSNVSNVSVDVTSVLALAQKPAELTDRLNLLLCAGTMSANTRTRLTQFLQGVPTSTSDLDRVRAAIYLTVTTQAAAVQK